MIKRSLSFAILIWTLGFIWFAMFLPQPAPMTKTDAVVVLTGGAHRIDRGLEVLREGKTRRMLISGVDRDVRPSELAAQYRGSDKLFDCCIDLGFQSIDTRSNALETGRWVKHNKVKTVRLVTSDWHMRRARFELDRSLPEGVTVIADAVPTRPSLWVLYKEYNKYWFRAAASLVGI